MLNMKLSFEKIRYKNGLYIGQFCQQSQKKEGIGFFLWENCDLYFGQFLNDNMEGRGILIENNSGV